MSKWWKRKKRITVNLNYVERERLTACINEHVEVLQHALDRYTTIPESERPQFVVRNMAYFKNAIGGLKWLKASIVSKALPERPQHGTTEDGRS